MHGVRGKRNRIRRRRMPAREGTHSRSRNGTKKPRINGGGDNGQREEWKKVVHGDNEVISEGVAPFDIKSGSPGTCSGTRLNIFLIYELTQLDL